MCILLLCTFPTPKSLHFTFTSFSFSFPSSNTMCLCLSWEEYVLLNESEIFWRKIFLYKFKAHITSPQHGEESQLLTMIRPQNDSRHLCSFNSQNCFGGWGFDPHSRQEESGPHAGGCVRASPDLVPSEFISELWIVASQDGVYISSFLWTHSLQTSHWFTSVPFSFIIIWTVI